VSHLGRSANRNPFMRGILLLITLHLFAPVLAKAERLVQFGDKQAVQLGTSLDRFKSIFPQAVRGQDWGNENTTLTTYELHPPASIDADLVRFFFENDRIIQIDHSYSQKRSSERGGWQFDYEALSELFGSPGQPSTKRETYAPQVKHSFTWRSQQTGEGSTLEVYPDGAVLVSFNALPGRSFTDTATNDIEISKSRQELSRDEPPRLSPSQEGAEIDRILKASRPRNGTIFLQTSTQGHGELTINNGTKFDALVKLVSPQRKYTFIVVYIHSGKSAKVTNIRPNTYKLVYALGEGWDEARNAMIRIASTAALAKLLTFVRSQDQYSTIDVTLHPVVDGNTQSIDISKDEFLAY